MTKFPAIEGITFRPIEVPADLAALADVYNRSYAAAGADNRITVEQLEVGYEHLENCHLPTDSVIAERDGMAVGYTRAQWRKETAGARTHGVYAMVVHEEVGSGLTRALIDWVEGRGRELADGDPSGVFDAWLGEGETEQIEILIEKGYRLDTQDSDMVRPNLDNIGPTDLPPGVEVRSAVPADFRTIWDASNEAFSDHYGFGGGSEEGFGRFVDNPNRDETLWQVAWFGDEVVGQVRTYINKNENEVFGRLRGYTEDISTGKQWRKQGIASALVNRSLHDLKARGYKEAALGVHLENETGAPKLYERLGFELSHRWLTYRKPMFEN